ncbi:hypothetical protein [Lyngbya sp. CCY1209]|nr:hypothetical protein [Lyngbya sp. CCY1209]MEB3883577.1 hypothetical protein [Lyngbya sp. CCY1209]
MSYQWTIAPRNAIAHIPTLLAGEARQDDRDRAHRSQYRQHDSGVGRAFP